MKKGYFYETAIGHIGIAEEDGFITNLFFGQSAAPDLFEVMETRLLARAAAQLAEYLRGERRAFDLPLRPEGTAFEREVWDALLEIPYGQRRTYGQIAERIGRPTASRAVGRAGGNNPVTILIPCHRAIGMGGEMVGYAGGVELKLRLLALEGGRAG